MRSEGSSAFSRTSTRAPWKLSAPHAAVWSLNGPRLGASAILLIYSLVAGMASLVTQSPGQLGLRLGRCGKDVCVDWVMPAGHAWHDGARPGMRVISLNGEKTLGPVLRRPLVEAELLAPDGQIIVANTVASPVNQPWTRLSLW